VSLAVGQSDRLIDVEWDTDIAAVFVASIEVKGLDRARLLRDVSAVLADHHVNIVSCNTITGSDRISKMRFDFELGDPSHLDSVIGGIKQIDGIYDAYRVLPGKGEVVVDKQPDGDADSDPGADPDSSAPISL
jgi:guanosine-3',5'-bis(diphosphate) 3'-pyrophosphohydrolase